MLLKMLFSTLYASIASISLLLLSFSVSIRLPRILHSFNASLLFCSMFILPFLIHLFASFFDQVYQELFL